MVLYTIPNIGPLVATLLPLPIVILEDFPLAKALRATLAPPRTSDVGHVAARTLPCRPRCRRQSIAVILVPGAIHVAMGNFVEPLLFSNRFTMTPVRPPPSPRGAPADPLSKVARAKSP